MQLRSRIAVLCSAGLAAIAVAGCGSSSPPRAHHAKRAAVAQALPGPAGLRSAGPPQPDGTIWVLSGSRDVKTLNQLNLSTRKQGAAVGVDSTAATVTQSRAGLLAVGIASGTAGAVQLRSGSSGALAASVAVSAPVRSLAFNASGTRLYVLNGTGTVDSVAVVGVGRHRLLRSFPVSSNTVAITNGAAGNIWAVDRRGVVEEISARTGAPLQSFPTGAAAIALAAAPGGGRLYVLKGTRTLANIAVVDLNTDAVLRALPAATDSVGLTMSLDGSQLYDLVGAAGRGNIQLIKR